MQTKQFTSNEVGCYADGALGRDHVRQVLADLIKPFCPEPNLGPSLVEELLEPMTDDASEEDDALELLNENTSPSLVWEFTDGDLILRENDD